jgi:hypothetical protein
LRYRLDYGEAGQPRLLHFTVEMYRFNLDGSREWNVGLVMATPE